MGTNQTKVQSKTKNLNSYDIKIIPSKAVFALNEDITGQIILEMKQDFNRAGLLVVSLDGKE